MKTYFLPKRFLYWISPLYTDQWCRPSYLSNSPAFKKDLKTTLRYEYIIKSWFAAKLANFWPYPRKNTAISWQITSVKYYQSDIQPSTVRIFFSELVQFGKVLYLSPHDRFPVTLIGRVPNRTVPYWPPSVNHKIIKPSIEYSTSFHYLRPSSWRIKLWPRTELRLKFWCWN